MSTDHSRQLTTPTDPDLTRLPPLEPPRDVLPRVLAEMRRRAEPRRRHGRWTRWAAAAVLMLSLGVIGLLTERMDRQSRELEQWVRYSQQLEAQLKLVGGRNQVVRGHRAAALGELESRLALVDWQLSRQPPSDHQIELWRQRALLLHDLVTVRAGERVLDNDRTRRPVVTINGPRSAIPASYEI